MAPSFLSFVAIYSYHLRNCFNGAGLTQQAIDIDDETTIHFWGPKSKHVPQKPSLVLIHGFGPVSLWQWRQQVQFFAPDFNVYVPDLVFFGDSMTKSSERSEIFQASCVAKLLEKLGVEKYSIVGTSYGGFVTYNIARMWPERVEKVVIASSGVNMRKSDNDELVKRANIDNIYDLMLPTKASHARPLLSVAVYRRLNMVPDFFLNDFVERLYLDKGNEKLELLKGLTIGGDETINISPLQQDVLLLWGDQDQIFPLKMAHELQGLIGKNVKLEVIKDSSHIPQMEHPREFNKILQSFLCASS